MKKLYATLSIAIFGAMLACQQDELTREIPSDVISQLRAAGFDTSEGLSRRGDGYLVEYDIYLTSKQIAELSAPVSAGAHAEEEHYRTFNLVTGSPRTINVWMDPSFDTYMQN